MFNVYSQNVSIFTGILKEGVPTSQVQTWGLPYQIVDGIEFQ